MRLAVVLGLVWQAGMIAESSSGLERLHPWTRTRASAPSEERSRHRLSLILATLEQATERIDSGEPAGAELEVARRLRKSLSRDPWPGDLTAHRLREASKAYRDAIAAAGGERPPSQITMQSEGAGPASDDPSFVNPPLASTTSSPRQAELDEDTVVLLTPEIRAKAASLDNNPAKIYAFVRNNIGTEWHRGAMQNSLSVLWSGKAGAVDQATLLIALLRAAGVPARYVFGSIRFSTAQLMDWVGGRTTAASVVLVSQAQLLLASGGQVTMDHTWVEASVNGEWVSLDPSLKGRLYQPGYAIPRIPFRRDAFLKSVTNLTAGEMYLDQIRDYLRANEPGRSLSELAYTGPIRSVPDTSLPPRLDYTVLSVARRVAALERTDMHRVVLSLRSANQTTTYFSKELLLPEVCLRSLSISSAAPGGAASPRAGATAYKPQLVADDDVIAEGTTALLNTVLNLRVQYFPIGGDVVDLARVIQPGQLLGIPFYTFQNDRYLNHRIDSLLAKPRVADTGPSVRDILNITGVRYLQRLNDSRRTLTAPLQLAPVFVRAQFGYVTALSTGPLIADRPLLTPMQLGMDMVGSGRIPLVDLNAVDASTPDIADFRRTIGLTASGLEHQVLEEIAVMNSVSTTKTLQLASEQGIPLVSVTGTNAAAVLAPLPYTSVEKAQIAAALNGAPYISALLPARPVMVGDFRVFAYITEDALGFGNYLLFASAGGLVVTAGAVPQPAGTLGDPTARGGTAVGDPVDVSNGNLIFESTDLVFRSRGFPIVFRRTYNSQSATSGPLGPGWTHSYNMSLRISAAAAFLINESGGTYTFARGSTGEWRSDLSLGLTIRQEGTDYLMRNRRGFQWRFGSAGRLRDLTDPNGNQVALNFDATGKLMSLADPTGRMISLTYDDRSRITGIVDPTGRKAAYAYDSSGRLSESVDAAGNSTTYTYYSGTAAEQNLKTVTDPEGNVTTYVYYADDKIFKTVRPGQGEMAFFYMPYRQTTVAVDERGIPTTYLYDQQGRITQTIDVDGNSSWVRFNGAGLVEEAGDENGAVNLAEYDGAGNRTRVTDPLGNETRYTYESTFNQITSRTDARGNTSRYEYDAKGNLVRLTDALGAVTAFSYDPAGNLSGVTDAGGNRFAFTYDANGFLTEAGDPMGGVVRYGWDGGGRVTRITNPLGDSLKLDWDAMDRLVRTVSPRNNTTDRSRDRAGRLVRFSDANRNETRYTFDGLDNLTSVATATGAVAQYFYAPDDCRCVSLSNLLSAVRDPNSVNAMGYRYNHRGQPTELRNGVGDVTRLSYDARGHLVESSTAGSGAIRRSYDLAGRLTQIAQAGGFTDSFSYDENGNLTSASNPNVTYNFGYDGQNRITSVQDSRFADPIRYSYDAVGRLMRITDPSGGVTDYTYDGRGYVTSIRAPGGLLTAFSYDAAGRRMEDSYANGTKAAYQWDADGRLLSLKYTAGTKLVQQFGYEYDNAGNQLSMADSAGRHEYTYDASYSLTGATHPGQPAEMYVYDGNGNRTSSHRDPRLVYDAANRLAGAGTLQFAFDDRGNQIRRGAQTFTYDQLRRITGADGPQANATYRYDPFGNRIEKVVNGTVTRYLYSGASILQEYDGENRLSARFTYGLKLDEILLMERDRNADGVFDSSEAFFYQRDALGSVRALADMTGNLVEEYSYDAFGNLTGSGTPAGAVRNPFLFTGREWDQEIGLYYYRARHYDPTVGRFLQEDAIWTPFAADTLNRYAYVGNNPVNFVDPDGNQRHNPGLAAIGEVNSGGNSGFGDDRGKDRGRRRYFDDEEDEDKNKNKNKPWVPVVYNPDKLPNRVTLSKEAEEELQMTGRRAVPVVLGAAGAYFIYRGVRTIPSLTPPTLWTLPANLATP